MGFASKAKHCSLKGPIHGGSSLVFPHLRSLSGFPAFDSAVFFCFKSLTRQAEKNPLNGEHPIAFKTREGRARENPLWGAILPQQGKWVETLPGLFQLSLLGNSSLDPRCFIALDVSCAVQSYRFTLAEDLALVLELFEDQMCPLKHLTTCWCHHRWVGHNHGVKGSPCLWDGGVPPFYNPQ